MKIMTKLGRKALAISAFAFLALQGGNAHALVDFDITNLSILNEQKVTDILKAVSIGTDHRALMPATAQGMLLGIDVGVNVALMPISDDVMTILEQISGKASPVPGMIPVPALSVHKGLPFGLDLGASMMSLGSTYKSFGVDAKYSIIDNIALPAVAIRASYGSSTLWAFKSSVFKVDLVASKNLLIVDPYVGVGMQFWSGEFDTTGITGTQLPVSVSGKASGSAPHFYIGTPLKLGFLRMTAEVDYSTTGITTYAGKFSLGF